MSPRFNPCVAGPMISTPLEKRQQMAVLPSAMTPCACFQAMSKLLTRRTSQFTSVWADSQAPYIFLPVLLLKKTAPSLYRRLWISHSSTVCKALILRKFLFIGHFEKLFILCSWQFPNVNLTCNTVSSNDLDNYLKLIQEMRNSTVLQHLTISATVPVKPWVNASGNHAENLSDFAQVLDFIELMNYDTWNTGQSVVGANSPLDDGCAPAGDQRGSVTKTVNTWKSAGFSQDQILVGAPTYGYLYNVPLDAAYSNGVLAQYPPTNGSGSSLMGDSWSAPEDPHWCSGLQPARESACSEATSTKLTK